MFNLEESRNQIDDLYALYGFEKDKEEDFCNVYIYDQGYFNNSEIVVFNENQKDKIEKIKEGYIQSGYSVSVREGVDYQKLKDELFNGFFKIKASNNSVMREYEEYCELQTKRLGGIKYSYIEAQYTLNGHIENYHILDKIFELLNKNDAQLVILEAPAGFGKTCTSYEIANMLARQGVKRIPILAELSKNRKAKIFSYVLLAEIDKKFSKLESNLVTKQIVNGNIPLIIDGFDELLSKSSIEVEDGTEDAKSMLDTIANLLEEDSKAKILLTSRKSSIFTGELFDEWVVKKLEYCNISRIQILPPTVEDWIGKSKKNLLNSAGIQLELVANPVLLSMLKSVKLEMFSDQFHNTSDILEAYFTLLLTREKERQQLLISVDEQRGIMRKLAAMMVLLNISSDESEGIKALIEEIVSPEMAQYMSYYNCYLGSDDFMIPTEDELIMKLVHNALLDRINLSSNCIGFINEFIFGILIGEAVIYGDLEAKELSTKYLNLAVTSFVAEKRDNRIKLYDLISKCNLPLTTEQKITLEANLVGQLDYDYVDEYISDTVFEAGMNMQTQHYFYNCTFSSCTFDKCKIDNNLFEGCYFYNCNFYDLKIDIVGTVEEESTFISCNSYEPLQECIRESLKKIEDKNDKKDEVYYERLVLEQYWMPGSDRAELRKTLRTLYKGIKPQDRTNVMLAIDSLIDKKILKRLNYCLELSTAQMTIVKEILGR